MRMLRIGEVGDLVGVDAQTLRQWDRRGILPAVRTPSGQRRYPRGRGGLRRAHAGGRVADPGR